MIACTAALSWMTHGDAGAVLALGERRRRPSSAIRRAARERDAAVPVPRLRVPPDRPAPHPALDQRRPHRPGQPDQPVPLSPQAGPRPRLPHRRPARRRHVHVLPPGRHAPAVQPPLPEPDGPIDQAHDAAITPDTIIPPWYGERLDLNHAIWACFANARTKEEEPGQDGAPVRPGSRHHLRARRLGRTLSPVPRTRPPALRPHPDPNSGLTK